MYTLSQAVFGVGVGGEYPIASTSASERAEADEQLHDRRGETVMLTFSMQGGCSRLNVLWCTRNRHLLSTLLWLQSASVSSRCSLCAQCTAWQPVRWCMSHHSKPALLALRCPHLRSAAAAGWGNWMNTAVLLLIMAALGQTGPASYSNDQLEAVRASTLGLKHTQLLAEVSRAAPAPACSRACPNVSPDRTSSKLCQQPSAVERAALCAVAGVAAELLPGAGAGGGHAVLAPLRAGGVRGVARQAAGPAAGGVAAAAGCLDTHRHWGCARRKRTTPLPPQTMHLICRPEIRPPRVSRARRRYHGWSMPATAMSTALHSRKPVLTVGIPQQGKGREFDLWKAACWARTYWHRLAGTALSWFVWDFAFYGARPPPDSSAVHLARKVEPGSLVSRLMALELPARS